MKKLEITRISLRSIFKGIISLTTLLMLMLCGSLILVILTNKETDKVLSIIQVLCVMVLSPILCGGVGIVFGISYNWLAPKIGGFKVEVKDDTKSTLK